MTYKLKDYVKDAIRTDIKVDEISADPYLLGGVISILIAAGNILDQIKKGVFYNREYDKQALVEEFMVIVSSLDMMKPSLNPTEPMVEGFIPIAPRLFHSIVGITTESTELLEALSVAFEGKEIDTVNVLEEFGDLNWYQALGIDELDGDFEQVLRTNIEKLRARYPEKFSEQNALNRDLEREREILEQGNKN